MTMAYGSGERHKQQEPTILNFLEAMGEDYAIDWEWGMLSNTEEYKQWDCYDWDTWNYVDWDDGLVMFDITKDLLEQSPELQNKCLELLTKKDD